MILLIRKDDKLPCIIITSKMVKVAVETIVP